MTERHCLKCKHLWVDWGHPGYSEWTPGDPARLFCRKDHWTTEEAMVDKKSLARCLESARQCPDFEEDPT